MMFQAAGDRFVIADVFESRAVPRQRRLDKKQKKENEEAGNDAACFASCEQFRLGVLHHFPE